MSYWKDQYTNHSVHAELLSLIKVLESPECVTDNSEAHAKISKCIRVTQYAQEVLDKVDPEFISFSLLGSVNKQLKAAREQLSEFCNSKQMPPLDQVVSQCDGLLSNCSSLAYPMGAIHPNVIVNSADKISSASESAINKISSSYKVVDEKITGADTKINEFSQKIQQFGASIEESKNQLSEYIRISKDEHADNERKAKEAIAKLISDKQKEILEEIKGFANSASGCLDDLNAQFEEAKNLVGAIGNTGMTGHYQKMADQERERADTQRKFAYATMVVMLLLAGFTIWNITHVEWSVSALRLLALAIISLPAGYAIKESSKHRQYERIYRRAELELAALGPFISQLPDTEQQAIKKDLSGKYFGQQESPLSGDDGKYESLVDRGFTMLEKIVNKKI